jgi:predicted DsbA family dithiol-disulfide isomerase/uncharacterized membrane protein
MEQKKGLTLNGITGLNFLFIINAVCMIAVSIYLTTHYYEVLYPTKLGGAASLCNISNFFNCDAATYSRLSNIAGVPIAFFGIIIGLMFLFTSLMPSEAMERTASAFAKFNFIGCVVLFIFSLGALGSLCPFCTVYYILSGVACFLLWKYGINTWKPDLKVSAFWGVVLLIGSFFLFQNTKEKEDVRSKMNAGIVQQYRKLPALGDAAESAYKIHSSTKNFADAPIRISIFSDFECPFCKIVAEQMPELIRLYGKKLNIQYFFYPLDAKCNANVKGRFHQNACDAAELAACNPEKFGKVHDEIFEHQDQLKGAALAEIAKRNDLEGCIGKEENRNTIIDHINISAQFNLKSTPTIILNGKKIEGTIPVAQYFAIFEDILSGEQQK